MTDIERLIPAVQRSVSLAPYTTFRVGGPADYFVVGDTEETIRSAVRVARETNTPLFVLAGGSNVLFSDEGFRGIVVFVNTIDYDIAGETIRASAGVSMAELVKTTTERGLAGLEWAGGLPGTLGGAVRGNAGAFGGEIKDNVIEVRYVALEGDAQTASLKECEFTYRSSFFKTSGAVVLSATLRLTRGDPELLRSIAESHIAYRESRHPLNLPNAGSIFKNVPFALFPDALKESVRGVLKDDPFPVIPTAYLISRAGLAGRRVGGAEISEKHTNFIVNKNSASAKDVLSLILIAKKSVKEMFCVDLEVEIQHVE